MTNCDSLLSEGDAHLDSNALDNGMNPRCQTPAIATTVPNLAAAAADPVFSAARAPSAVPQYRYSPRLAAEKPASSTSRRGIGNSSVTPLFMGGRKYAGVD